MTGIFEQPAHLCHRNGMAELPACSGASDACQQRTQGAFGPNGGTVKTIKLVGAPAGGILAGPAATTLGSVFCIPPSFDATLDSAADLPGPGAVAIPGTLRLCSNLAACP
jgi:hypothetical protein